ncbi:uncharacterized protein LOC133340320 [Lethenteron reissneri]|uniref:uncharacterized protein LOC133340320 n=1 Tax=Lethenteron reissneri TaxID=7753 RepID=UPI002AB76C6E|nr:uncharacterized protein LOC133340320 [Lethenteron reissneri]
MSGAERVVLVLGGAGVVGSGAVRALLERGFRVAVISRDEARLGKLAEDVPESSKPRLVSLVGNVGSERGAEKARTALLAAAPVITDIVSCLGFSWWQGGSLLDQDLVELQRVFQDLLFSTFTAWKVFFPLVRANPSGSYTFVTGGAGDRLLTAGTGFLTVGAASVLAFSKVVREEYSDAACAINEVKINMGVVPPGRVCPGYVDHRAMGHALAAVVATHGGTGRFVCVSSTEDVEAVQATGGATATTGST